MILFIVATLMPAIARVRAAARKTDCLNHLLNNSLCALNATSVSAADAFPQGTKPNPNLRPDQRLSWYLANWGWMGDGQIALDVDWEGAWNDPQNLRIRTENMDGKIGELWGMPVLDCPSRPVDRAHELPRFTAYVGMAGVGVDPAAGPLTATSGIFGYDRVCPEGKVTRGLSNTVLLIETSRDNGPWTAGGPPTVRGYNPVDGSPLGVGRPFGGLHLQATGVGMADGSAKFLNEDIDSQVFASLLMIGAGDGSPAAEF